MYACTTLRSNRKGFPSDLKLYTKKRLKERGDYEIKQQSNITVAVWQDNKPVFLVATNVDPTKITSVKQTNKDGMTTTVPRPESPMLYNKYMGGVDLNDLMTQRQEIVQVYFLVSGWCDNNKCIHSM